MWQPSVDRTLAELRLVSGICASGQRVKLTDREPTALFLWVAYLSRMANSSSLSWPFALT
jgi:hypothetical protein